MAHAACVTRVLAEVNIPAPVYPSRVSVLAHSRLLGATSYMGRHSRGLFYHGRPYGLDFFDE